MKHTLNYGRIRWSYDEDFDSSLPCRPNPLMKFSPIRINGKLRYPNFSDKVALTLLTLKWAQRVNFQEAYKEWFLEQSMKDLELGEGRSFLRWLQKNRLAVNCKETDYSLHAYFLQPNSPKHDASDELSQGHSFAIAPVQVERRTVKLYLEDEAVINLINLPYGVEKDFLHLVKNYVQTRFQYEEWRAPAPTFLDWVKAQGLRPVFSSGQLGLSLSTD